MITSRRLTVLLVLLSTLTLCGLQPLSAQVTGVSLGFADPPPTLGGYAMTVFDPGSIAGQSYYSHETGGSWDGGGTGRWNTWGQSYTGNVYAGLGQTTLTLTLHGAVEAVDFYAEPNLDSIFSMTATDSSGASVTEVMTGSHGSAGAGFYEDVAGGPYLTSIKVTETDLTGFAVGEFAINGGTLSGQFGTVPDTSGTWAIMLFSLAGLLTYSRRASMPFGICLAPVGGRCPQGTFEN